MTTKHCTCGQSDCWDDGDYSWLASNSGWHGELHGCLTSVFFIHGKKIREQRHIPEVSRPIAEIIALLGKWSTGLPNARLVWSQDTGGGDASLWIEGERDPNDDDLRRLTECREKQRRQDEHDFARLSRKMGKADDAVARGVDDQHEPTPRA